MFERFTKDARAVVEAAVVEARDAGSATVEAEHLLLALARSGHAKLAAHGVDAAVIEDALAAEQTASLSAVGVRWNLEARPPATGQPRFAASAKLALQRALPAAVERGERRLTSDHVLAGVLTAEVGTVPRALAIAGIEIAV